VEQFDFVAYGEPFRVSTDLEGLAALYRELYQEPGSPVHAGPPISVRVTECATGVPSLKGVSVSYEVGDQTFVLSLGGLNAVELHEARDPVAVSIDPRWLETSPELVKPLLLEAPVLVSLSWRRMPYVHAAAVAWGHRGFLLAGQSGAGKSSLAYACTRIGFRFLAEDYVFVSFASGTTELRGSPSTLRLCTDAARHFPELSSVPPRLQVNGEWKVEAIAEVPVDRRAFAAELAGTFLLSPVLEPDQDRRARRVVGEELRRVLVDQMMFDNEGMLRRHDRRLSSVAARGAEVLPAAESPKERAQILKRLIGAL
jgi:hypothetical protein